MYSKILELLSTIIPMLSLVIGVFVSYIAKSKLDNKLTKEANNEINIEINKFKNLLNETDNDVLKLMYKNVAELREYYVINKQQARNSYSASLFMCFLGFILFSSGVAYSVYDPANNIIQYSTFGGVIIELIAGLFFWLYSKSIKQINLFHSSLQNTEKFLTAIQLVEKISEGKRDETYSNIINKIIERDIEK